MMASTQSGSIRIHVPWWAGRAGLLVLIVVVGYWLSLGSLWSDVGGQTPLSFVGLAPLLALGLLLAGLGRRQPLPMPGRVDLVCGLALIAAAGTILLLAPTVASIYFWTARLDVASLPLFAAGALILLFGWRVLFVSRGALVLLLMAWPLPYQVLIENTSEWLTNATAGALSAVTAIIPIATASPGGAAIFTVEYGPDPFVVQVASACAGLNSTVAFLLVGSAFALLVNGPLLGKLAWLASGLVVIFVLNVVRVVLLVAVGAAFGETAALQLFHPIAGMLALLLGLVVMLAALSRFGLRPPDLRPALPAASPLPIRPGPVGNRHGLTARVALLAVIAVLFGAVNGTFAAYDLGPGNAAGAVPLSAPVTPDSGATAGSVDVAGLAPSGPLRTMGGWSVTDEREITFGRPYFGVDSTWTRYRLAPGPQVPKADRYTIWVDNITVTDRQRLVDFGVERCYQFHGQSVDAAEPVVLGGGVVGRVIAITGPTGSSWVILWWEWPVELAGRILHERIALLASTTARPAIKPVEVDGKPIVLFNLGTAIPSDLEPLAYDMAATARRIVAEQSARAGA